MSEKSVAQKAHIKSGVKVAVLNEVPGVVASLGLPDDTEFVEPSAADIVLLFVREKAELEAMMRPAVDMLATGAALWVFFRKGSKTAGLDMNRNDVWSIAEESDMRPLGLIGVDENWSAFRLRRA